MELKTYFAQDRAGNVVPNATVTIYITGTNTLATGLKTVSDAALSNPFTANADGKIQFKAADGIYDMQIAYGNQTGARVTFQCIDAVTQIATAQAAATTAVQAKNDTQAIIDAAGEQSTLVVLAQPDGATKSGYNDSTVASELDSLNVNKQVFIDTKRKLVTDASQRTDFKYAAFCDGCLVNGNETFIHREGLTHLASGGGTSKLVISVLNKETGMPEPVKEFPVITGKDYRDPSIAYIPETRTVVVTTQIYDVVNNTYDGGTVYTLNLNLDVVTTTQVNSPGYFIWGKAIRTPNNKIMVAAYKLDGSEIGLFTSSGAPSAPTAFTKVAAIFNDDANLMRNEVAIGYYKGFLVAFARTQNKNDGSLQNASVTYTADKSGASGWTAVTRLTGSTVVAPRMFTNLDGGLVLSAGSIFGSYRGSVSTQVTFDLTTFSTRQTVYRNPNSDGGYASAFISNGRLVIYTYNETELHARSNTYLEYFNPDAVAPLVPVQSFDVNQFSTSLFIGGPIVFNAKSADSGYVCFSVNTAINNVTSIVFAAEPVSTPNAQLLLLQTQSGAPVASFGSVTPTSAGIYISTRAAINIPPGVYRLTLPNARLLYVSGTAGKRIPALPYTTVNVDGVNTDTTKHVALGFVTN